MGLNSAFKGLMSYPCGKDLLKWRVNLEIGHVTTNMNAEHVDSTIPRLYYDDYLKRNKTHSHLPISDDMIMIIMMMMMWWWLP